MGFITYPDKSIFCPLNVSNTLGSYWTRRQTVTLTPERAADLVSYCRTEEVISIRDIERTIGKIVASFPAVMFGPLHYRQMEEEKKTALKHCGKL